MSAELAGPVEVRSTDGLDANAGTYERPPHGWTCFHCGETFKNMGCASDHFGAKPDAQPGCMIRVSLGHERGLLMALRKVENELASLYLERGEEDTRLHRELHRLQSRHGDALQTAEEAGYARGLRAGMALASNV